MSRNAELLEESARYCREHPEQRFWQALRNWSGASYVQVVAIGKKDLRDTFHFEGKNS
jgi:hypothetical protein